MSNKLTLILATMLYVVAQPSLATKAEAGDGYRFYNVEAYTQESATVNTTLYIHMEDSADESSTAMLKKLSAEAFLVVASKHTVQDFLERHRAIAAEVKEEINKVYIKNKKKSEVERVQFEELVLSETIRDE